MAPEEGGGGGEREEGQGEGDAEGEEERVVLVLVLVGRERRTLLVRQRSVREEEEAVEEREAGGEGEQVCNNNILLREMYHLGRLDRDGWARAVMGTDNRHKRDDALHERITGDRLGVSCSMYILQRFFTFGSIWWLVGGFLVLFV